MYNAMGLSQHFDLLLSTHTFGYLKEDQRLFLRVREHTGFDPARTLFIDDIEPILDAASQPLWYRVLSWRQQS